jgi:hypothetical protein
MDGVQQLSEFHFIIQFQFIFFHNIVVFWGFGFLILNLIQWSSLFIIWYGREYGREMLENSNHMDLEERVSEEEAIADIKKQEHLLVMRVFTLIR